jgi:Domain of unknown function (DUF4349)
MKASTAAFTATVLVTLIFTGCSKNVKDKEPTVISKTTVTKIDKAEPPAPPAGPAHEEPMSSSAAVENNRDSIHQFIRTADAKFKVDNVARATYRIEDITRQLGGYVSYTNLTSKVNSKYTIAVSADSSLQTTNYEVQNSMIIRVPNTMLDTALKALAPLVAYLDYRQVKANDVALQLLANRLKQARIAKNESRMIVDIDENRKKLSETTDARETLLNHQEQADNARIDNLSVTDQVKFSTINLSLYQDVASEKTMVFNEKSVTPYQPGLLTQVAEAAQFGWNLFTTILVFAVRIWPLLFIGLALSFGYRRFRKIAF